MAFLKFWDSSLVITNVTFFCKINYKMNTASLKNKIKLKIQDISHFWPVD
jgi:hypothetical protein